MTSLTAQINRDTFRRELGDFPQVDHVIQNYFSTYAEGLLPVTDRVLQMADALLQRKAQGLVLRNRCYSILYPQGRSLESSHRMIAGEEILKRALTEQFKFDGQLLRLKRWDRCQKLFCQKVFSELKSLESGTESKLLTQLKEKAAALGKPLNEVVQESIRMRKALLSRLDERMHFLGNPYREIMLIPDDLMKSAAPILPIEEGTAHTSLKKHYVHSVGDPLLGNQGKFLIVKRPKGIADEDWEEFVSFRGTETLLAKISAQGQTANKPFFINFLGKQVELCYENPSKIIDLHANKDSGEKTRRCVEKNGDYKRENANISGKKKGWTDNKEATAGADFHEAILFNRRLIDLVLSGKSEQLPQNICQNLATYFDALPDGYVANLEGSYGNDPRFLQAMRLHTFAHENFKTLIYPHKIAAQPLEQEENIGYTWKKDNARAAILTHDLFDSYANWRDYLANFLVELEKPENRPVKDTFGAETMAQLGSFLIELGEFSRDAIPPAIQEAMEQQRPINKRYDSLDMALFAQLQTSIADPVRTKTIEKLRIELNQDRQKELDAVWSNWRKGKTAQEIDAILSGVLTQVRAWLKRFAPALTLINASFSSNRRQERISDSMSDNPALLSLYQKVIPPIWQNKVKTKALIEGELMRGTELSPLWLEALDTLTVANQELMKNEFIVSRLGKQYIANPNRPYHAPRHEQLIFADLNALLGPAK